MTEEEFLNEKVALAKRLLRRYARLTQQNKIEWKTKRDGDPFEGYHDVLVGTYQGIEIDLHYPNSPRICIIEILERKTLLFYEDLSVNQWPHGDRISYEHNISPLAKAIQRYFGRIRKQREQEAVRVAKRQSRARDVVISGFRKVVDRI